MSISVNLCQYLSMDGWMNGWIDAYVNLATPKLAHAQQAKSWKTIIFASCSGPCPQHQRPHAP